MNRKKTSLLIVVFFILHCLLAGCSAKPGDTLDHTYWNSNNFITNGDYIEFPCDYGTLKYPAKWSNSLVIECQKNDDTNVNIFYYVDGEKKAEIARLSFGTKDGFLVGNVEDCEISLRLGDIQTEQWSESDVLNYCAMQEDINEMLAHLTELKGFTKN